MSNPLEVLMSNVKGFGSKLEAESTKAAEIAAEKVLEVSTQYVPVVTGALRASGKVLKERGQVFVLYTEDYAIDVHENSGSTGYKFLERAMQETDVKGIITTELGKRLK